MQKIKILSLLNTDTPDIFQEGNLKFQDWLQKEIKNKTGKATKVEIEYKRVSIPITYKIFGSYPIYKDGKLDRYEFLWGVDGVKEKLRQAGVIESGYDIIQFAYNPENKVGLANWTYGNLLEGGAFCEFPINPQFSVKNVEDAIRHEAGHCFVRLLWAKGVSMQDNFDNPEVSEKENYDVIGAWWNKILKQEEIVDQRLIDMVGKLEKVVGLFSKLVRKTTILNTFAKAIQQYEGWLPPNKDLPQGSRSYRNKNPGNLKYATWQKAINKDEDSFAIYSAYVFGFGDLKNLIDWAMEGRMISYNPDQTLIEFFRTYAPASDNNEPVAYAQYVAKQLRVDPQTKLRDLI